MARSKTAKIDPVPSDYNEEPPINIKLEIVQSIAEGLRKDIDNLQMLIGDVAKSAGVKMPESYQPTYTPPHKKPYDDEHQPFSFGPAPIAMESWIAPSSREELEDRDLVMQELEEFTALNGGFKAIPCTTVPMDTGARKAGGAICFFTDTCPVAVNKGGLCMMTDTKPMIVGGSKAATGMYVPFAVVTDPEGIECTRKMIDFITDKDARAEMRVPEFMYENGML